MTATSVRFRPPSSTRFVSDVREAAASYFRDTGRSPKANAAMWVRTLVMLAVWIVPYVLLLAEVVTGPAALLLCAAVGVGVAGLGFAPCHDGMHGAFTDNRWLTRACGGLFEMLGGNAAHWRLTHNRIHHTFTNITGVDDDLDTSPLLRFSPRAPWRPVHRFQHWYAFPLYSLATLNWLLMKDFSYFFRKEIGGLPNQPRTVGRFAVLLAGKLVAVAWSVILPIAILRPSVGEFLLGFLVMHATAGLILGVVFQLAHASDQVEFPDVIPGGEVEHAWMVHQLRTTSNFATRNRFVGWFVAGLNFQVEHHLFPSVCSVHYPKLAPLVEACAKRHGLPYHAQPTVASAMAAHWRLMRDNGRRPAAQPA
jgi:linoleoyl-CoA desaturase